jgi:hypothetical protein
MKAQRARKLKAFLSHPIASLGENTPRKGEWRKVFITKINHLPDKNE